MMKKNIEMMVEFFSKVSHDLKRTLKLTLEGIIYSGGVYEVIIQRTCCKKENNKCGLALFVQRQKDP